MGSQALRGLGSEQPAPESVGSEVSVMRWRPEAARPHSELLVDAEPKAVVYPGVAALGAKCAAALAAAVLDQRLA